MRKPCLQRPSPLRRPAGLRFAATSLSPICAVRASWLIFPAFLVLTCYGYKALLLTRTVALAAKNGLAAALAGVDPAAVATAAAAAAAADLAQPAAQMQRYVRIALELGLTA